MNTSRRIFLQAGGGAALASLVDRTAFAQERHFEPRPGRWRTFEVTTRVEIAERAGATRLWLPVPSVDSAWQQSLVSGWRSNGQAQVTHAADGRVTALAVSFSADESAPFAEVTSRVRTQDRAVDWSAPGRPARDAALEHWTRPTALVPTDGIVRATALEATRGAHGDVEQVRGIYQWLVKNAYREPKVRGCGEGDIKTILETGNLGGKCADINAVFVGLCRSMGIPARDLYGLRLARSASGYSQLGADPANLAGAQHCRAEVWLRQYGWVAMDPADVTKVMRSETPEWIKTTAHPLVKPIEAALFGSWEGNWVAWNAAADVALPGAKQSRLGFFMYPIAENDEGPFDSYSPDDFKYRISAREIV